jgi:hypothetical protein
MATKAAVPVFTVTAGPEVARSVYDVDVVVCEVATLAVVELEVGKFEIVFEE